MKRVSVDQTQGALRTDARASITQRSIGQKQGSSNKTNNRMGTGIKSHKKTSSETKRTKTRRNFSNENQRHQTSSSYNHQNENQNKQGASYGISHRINWKKRFSQSADECAEQQQETAQEHAVYCGPTAGNYSSAKLNLQQIT